MSKEGEAYAAEFERTRWTRGIPIPLLLISAKEHFDAGRASAMAQVIAGIETEIERLRHSRQQWLTAPDPTRAAWYNGGASTLHDLAATLTGIEEELE